MAAREPAPPIPKLGWQLSMPARTTSHRMRLSRIGWGRRWANSPSLPSATDHRALLEESFFRPSCHKVAAPIMAQMTLTAAEGYAPFQPLLTTKPIAPMTLSHW